ncbi:MAG: zinc dependent phospholipase C family protein [Chloroflexi bacterium]|nr:zinc dependent phospholipase C family protein [Chloroflexota bacterium]
MPPITLHMVLARDIARGISDQSLLKDQGPYLLGATSPDIRVITRQDRFSTHFFDLSGPDHQDSVGGFFSKHARLLEPDQLNSATRAWVCGYIGHLVMDEQYITNVYRRFFAQHEALGGTMRANVMDRLLQFDLDRSYGNDPDLKRSLCEALSFTVENIHTGFIEHATLDRWRQVSYDVAARTMDWDRMRGMISNHLRYSGLEEGESLTSFLDSLPELLDETIGHITSTEVAGFVERSKAAAMLAVERYLGCG